MESDYFDFDSDFDLKHFGFDLQGFPHSQVVGKEESDLRNWLFADSKHFE